MLQAQSKAIQSFPIRPNVNSHIMTDAIFVMKSILLQLIFQSNEINTTNLYII